MTVDELAAMEKARDECPCARQISEHNAFLHGFKAGLEYARATMTGELPDCAHGDSRCSYACFGKSRGHCKLD